LYEMKHEKGERYNAKESKSKEKGIKRKRRK
jgi:hypothetical protein